MHIKAQGCTNTVFLDHIYYCGHKMKTAFSYPTVHIAYHSVSASLIINLTLYGEHSTGMSLYNLLTYTSLLIRIVIDRTFPNFHLISHFLANRVHLVLVC